MQQPPVFLIGFMGSGKTSLGYPLAQLLRFEFIDLDQWIEQREGKTIHELFVQEGESVFRQKERAYLRSLPLGQRVIATGGGTPCHEQNMDWMNRVGTTVYLQVDAQILYERLLPHRNERPLLRHLSPEELLPFIKRLLAQREPYYRQAKHIVCADQLRVEQLHAVLTSC